jgi:hypothetical protein
MYLPISNRERKINRAGRAERAVYGGSGGRDTHAISPSLSALSACDANAAASGTGSHSFTDTKQPFNQINQCPYVAKQAAKPSMHASSSSQNNRPAPLPFRGSVVVTLLDFTYYVPRVSSVQQVHLCSIASTQKQRRNGASDRRITSLLSLASSYVLERDQHGPGARRLEAGLASRCQERAGGDSSWLVRSSPRRPAGAGRLVVGSWLRAEMRDAGRRKKDEEWMLPIN